MSPPPATGGSTSFNAAVNLAKYCIGAGVLALPYATAKGGLIFSPIMIAVIATWNFIASSLLMECKAVCTNVAFPPHLSSTYSKMAYAGAGQWGVLVTDMSIIMTLLGVCIAFQITFATLLHEVPGNFLSNTALTIISGIVVYPLSCLRDMDAMASLSLVGMVCLVAGVAAIIAHGVHAYGSIAYSEFAYSEDIQQLHERVALWPASLADTAAFLGVTIFCFDICSLAFPIQESMQHKHEFGTAVLWSLVFVWLVYVLLGDIGAVLYVHDVSHGIRENILSNLPVHSTISLLVRWAMACVGLLTYPITLAPAAQMLEHHLATTYEHLLRSSGPSSARNSASYSPIEEDFEESPRYARRANADAVLSSPSPRVDTTKIVDTADWSEPSVYTRCGNRFFMGFFTTVVAAYIPCFGMVISLLGGFTIAILDFILPPLLHLRIVCYRAHRRLPLVPLAARLPVSTESYEIELPRRLTTNIPFHELQKPDSEQSFAFDRDVEGYQTSSDSLKDSNNVPVGVPVRRYVVVQDIALLCVGTVVCVVSTVLSVISIYEKLSSGQAC
eukprot:gene17187-19595_t